MTMAEGAKATVDLLLVADANDDLPSTGKLLRQGFCFNLSMEDGLFMAEGHRSAQLELERNWPRRGAPQGPGGREPWATGLRGGCVGPGSGEPCATGL